MNPQIREKIREFLSGISSPQHVYEFFKILNYPQTVLLDVSYKRNLEEFEFKKEEIGKIKNIYTILNFEKELVVFLVETTSLGSSLIRYISKVFSDKYENFLLIITPNYKTFYFVFPEFERVAIGKHKLKITKLFFQRDDLYYTAIETLSNIYYEGTEKNWRDVYKKWKEAFNVNRVTEQFFEDYKKVFFKLRENLIKQKITPREAHEFTLQFLNRIMFIYFISKKRWLNNEPRFMKEYWRRYLASRTLSKVDKDSFYEHWLKPLFFKAFNNRQSEIEGLPDDIKNWFFDFPYLNGGLFTENELDKLNVKINDELIKEIFTFYNKYNFTIKEDMPLELEVAVDPQMLGYVYESLANVAEEIYDRTDMGIFYTPKVEVDFMCRRALVEYLAKKIMDIPKEKIYELVFDEDKEKVEHYFSQNKLWHKLETALDSLSVVDPASGSGGFLVGMMNVLYELYNVIYRNLNLKPKPFALKKDIIHRSLYGVDIMPWAVHAAELRLWLQLMIETDFSKEDLKKSPLLPNLNLNLRVGDSLVQELGNVSLNFRIQGLSINIKQRLNNLKKEKENYFYNRDSKFQTRDEILAEELRIFNECLDEQIAILNRNINSLNESLSRLTKKSKQLDLSGKAIPLSEQKKLFDEKLEIEQLIRKYSKEKMNIEIIKNSLTILEKKPFVWEIDFAEIFGDKGGFDIVIGNPPYVRQEKISPPNKLKAEVTFEDRKEYKSKLIQSVKIRFPCIENIDKKSDYYIYFYLHGLSLLNRNGTFCFITSNSWLDVGYGRQLQEFLCKYVPIVAIYDNPKRSFEHADVNTIIALFGAPQLNYEITSDLIYSNPQEWTMLNHTAKFVMFKKPFEEVLSSKNLIDIENIKAKTKGEGITELVKNVVSTSDYRVFPIIQEDLLEDGWDYPENYKNGRFRVGSYEGNKWGGKYLRAPDIFYTILEKGKNKLVELGKIAKVRRGFTTGANEFFYLDEEAQKKWNIEKEFLRPVIKSPKECETIIIEPKKLKFKVFLCNKSKPELKETNALKYIEWGENLTIEVKSGGEKGKKIKGFHKLETVKNRAYWYGLGHPEQSDFVQGQIFNDRFLFSRINNLFVDCVFNELILYDKYKRIIEKVESSLNSSVVPMFIELFGRASLGEGALKMQVGEIRKIILLNPETISKTKSLESNREIRPIFEELGINPDKPIREQEPNPLPDRAELDNIIFDELGLTNDERKEVYWAVCELVKQRLDKATSLKRDYR